MVQYSIMAETKGQSKDIQRGYFAFVFTVKNHAMESYTRKKERMISFMEKLNEYLSPVIVFFAFLFSLLRGFFLAIKHGIRSLIAMVRSILYFEYKQFLLFVKTKAKEYLIKSKAKACNILWMPIRKRIFRLRKQARKKFLDVRIYFLGFLELCRRLFLLVSDYTPGGQWTVGLLLLLFTIFIGIEMFRYSKFVFKVLDLALTSMMFLLSPVIWTLQDVWIVIALGLNIFLSLLQYIWFLFIAVLQGIGDFILRVLTAFFFVIYRILSWIFEVKCVQHAWHVFVELTLITMEVFIFKVLPVWMTVVSHVITISTIASKYFYEYFVAVYAGEETKHAYFSHTRICAAFFTFICLILAYRLRKTFPSDLCQEIEQEEGSSARTRGRTRRLNTARYFRTGGKDDTTGLADGVDEVHFQLSSSAHICTGFLRRECKRGRRCDGHHCPWPYHWQYRVPVQGWKSFTPADSDTLEKLYCDPTNEIIKTSAIDPDLSALTRRSHVKSDTPIRLDFQQMRMEVNYYRSELRRLATESYMKKPPDDQATRWVWYRLTDLGEWEEYGNKENSIPKQEAIEAAYIRRESSYNYKKERQDYRMYFFMTPMYERNMNPREYKRRLIRRRPEYQPLET